MRFNPSAIVTAIVIGSGLMVPLLVAQESAPKAMPGQPAPANPAQAVPTAPPLPGAVSTQPVVPIQPPAARPALGPLQNNVIAWDAEMKETTVPTNETQAHFTFNLTNISSGDVAITAVSPGCGCTVAQLASPLPWKLTPGATAQIPLTMTVAPNTPPVIKTVTVSTDKGAKTLMIKATGTSAATETPAPAPAGQAKAS